jgi:hypothetical protein
MIHTCCLNIEKPPDFARGLSILYGAEGSRTPVHPCLLTYHSSTGLAALTQAAGTNFVPVSGIHCQILTGYATEDGLQSTHCIAYTRRGSKCKPRFCYAARATRAREKGTMLFALIVFEPDLLGFGLTPSLRGQFSSGCRSHYSPKRFKYNVCLSGAATSIGRRASPVYGRSALISSQD